MTLASSNWTSITFTISHSSDHVDGDTQYRTFINYLIKKCCQRNSLAATNILQFILSGAGNIDILSTEGVFFTSKGKVFFRTQHNWHWIFCISKVDVLWVSVDWVRNKCPLTTGVRIKGITKWVEFRENVMCPATVHGARFDCIQLVLLDELLF